MINMNKKEERNFRVLTHIIKIFVSDAVPVSSKSVTRNMGNSISSATVRNIMGELEEAGDIEQPHTSAGRVPTDRGYRKYVDFAKNRLEVEKKKAERLAWEYTGRIKSIKDVIEKTSFLISRELHHAGVVMWPSIGNFYLKHLELVKIRAEAVLAVLVTMTNAVKNYIISIDKDLEKVDLEKIANFINTNYAETTISSIPAELKDIVGGESENKELVSMARSARAIINDIVEQDIENEIYWEGLDYFAEEPEFMDLALTRRMLRIFSNRREISSLMRRELPYRGVRVYIGRENEFDALRECSVITAGYGLHGNTVGRIGVIGPTRMEYDNVLKTVRYLSDLISFKLEEFN